MHNHNELISEINIGNSNKAICIAVIGKDFSKLFASSYLH